MSAKSKEAVVDVEVPLYQDPWNPVLVASPKLNVSPEQEKWLREILDICCADSAFAKKAYDSIMLLLEQLVPVPLSIHAVNPSSLVQGATVLTTVLGAGFTEESRIWYGGTEWGTTFVDVDTLTFTPDTATVGVVEVYVQNYPANSNHLTFEVTEPIPLRSTEKEPVKKIDLGPELTKQKEQLDSKAPHTGQDKK